jgi:integrase
LGLQWDWIDTERAMVFLPDSKTGRKPVYLNAPALDVLSGLPRQAGNPHVICGHREGGAYVGLDKVWSRVRDAAGLSDVRLHDLRHSFASIGAAGGNSLLILGKLLGHRHAATTERYSHLSADPMRQAAEAIGQRIKAAMDRTATAEVLPLSVAWRREAARA